MAEKTPFSMSCHLMTATVQHLLSKEKHFDDDGDIVAKMFQLGALLPPLASLADFLLGRKNASGVEDGKVR